MPNAVQETQESIVAEAIQMTNSLGDVVSALSGGMPGFGFGNGGYQGVQLSQTDTLFINNRWYLISNLRQLLNQLYVEHGIVQTLVDQPVDDAFRAGFTIKTDELHPDEIEDLQVYVEKFQIVGQIMQAIKWKRLFGGGAVLIITDQDPKVPFNINRVTEDSPLEFRAVDMWELYCNVQNWEGTTDVGGQLGAPGSEFYNYYGKTVHESRALALYGKEAPSFIRPRLRGWGMSELERLVRSLNQYMKNQDVIFELLDEAKVDIYKIKGMNAALMNGAGTRRISERIQHANMIKNFNNALTMDTDDEYQQKQITFAGLAEVLVQIRQGIAADLKMPVTKLFGISAAGFSSGEDDIENYNSMIEGEIRSKDKFIVIEVLKICCKKLFNKVPDDLMITFPSLRILDATQEEDVKNKQFNRVMAAYTSGLVSAKDTKIAINAGSLLPVDIDENEEPVEPINGDFLVSDGDKVDSP